MLASAKAKKKDPKQNFQNFNFDVSMRQIAGCICTIFAGLARRPHLGYCQLRLCALQAGLEVLDLLVVQLHRRCMLVLTVHGTDHLTNFGYFKQSQNTYLYQCFFPRTVLIFFPALHPKETVKNS